ncbi:hypothetical protein D910_10390 [Dendroctonus ponderosae]
MKEYEQAKSQVKYNTEEQYDVPVQQYQMRSNSFPFTQNRQPEMMLQSNFRVTDDPMMLPLPQVYQFDNHMFGYQHRPNDQPYYADPAAVLTQNSHSSKPKSKPVKRVRTQYTSQQLIQLDSQFAKNNYLSRASRINLSQQLKLTEKQIKVWFQNRRMKNKKDTVSSTDRPISSSRSSYRRNFSQPNDVGFQEPRQIQRYEPPLPFSFSTSAYPSTSAFHQPIPNQLSANFPPSHELLSLSDMYLRESDVIPNQAMSGKAEGIEELNIPQFNLDESYIISSVNETTSPGDVSCNFSENCQVIDDPEICSDSYSSSNGLTEL